jgi:prevent-host-death family protein
MMCYRVLHEALATKMSEGGPPVRVGVRELRQNLSVYLRRVEKGETLDVTEHGRLVARLAPAPAPETSILDRLAAEHRARPAGRPISALPQPIHLPPGSPTASETLRRLREDERP